VNGAVGDRLGPLTEPDLHPGEGLEERDGVGEHVGTDHLADRLAASVALPC
jgi:hypothetical protein